MDWTQGRKHESDQEIKDFKLGQVAKFVQRLRDTAANPATVPYQGLILEQADRIEKDGYVSAASQAHFANFLAAGTPEEKARLSKPSVSGFTVSDADTARTLRSLGRESLKFLDNPHTVPRAFKR